MRQWASQVPLLLIGGGRLLTQHGFAAIDTQNALPGMPSFQSLRQMTGAAAEIHPKPCRNAVLTAKLRELTSYRMLQRR